MPKAEKDFKKRDGTTNKGSEYESYNTANVALNLVIDENIKSFGISSNDDAYGAFDDIVVDFELINGEKESYAIQLKHKDKNELKKEFLQRSKDFSLDKYFESFLKIKKLDKYILFTTLNFSVEEAIEIQIPKDEKFVIKPFKTIVTTDYINTSKDADYCYQFEIVEPANEHENSQHQKFKEFLTKFFLYAGQQNLDELKISIGEKFKAMFLADEFDKFFKIISTWCIEKKNKERLNKEWMLDALAIYALSSTIKPLSFGEVNDNMKILRDAISLFDFTMFKNETSYNAVKELWGDIKDTMDIKEMNKMNRNYQFDSNYFATLDDITPEVLSKLIWLLKKCPLLVTKNDTVQKVVFLCENKRQLILFDEDLDKDWLKGFSLFQTLHDLKVKDPSKYDQIIKTFTYCLQGKQEFILETLAEQDPEFLDFITTDDLSKMLKTPWQVGGDREKICKPYLPRFISRNIIDMKFLGNIGKETVLIIDSVNDINALKNKFPRHDFISVKEYLADNNDHEDHNLSTVIVDKNKCDLNQWDEICKKNGEDKMCHHLRFENSESLEWIRSLGDIKFLQKFKLSDEYFESEKQLFSSEPENRINIITTDPGMGKSELMKSLKNNYFDTYWTVMMYPKNIEKLFSYKIAPLINEDSIEKLIFDIKYSELSENEEKMFNILLKFKKIIFVWDSVDEISRKHLEKFTNAVKLLARKGFIQWVTSRLMLKSLLEKGLNVLSRNLAPFNEKEQELYMEEKLKNLKISEIKNKIRSTFGFIDYEDLLQTPVQISILTDFLAIDDHFEKLTNDLLLTDLYDYFIEQKFRIYFVQRIEADIQRQEVLEFLQPNKSKILKYFKILALRTLFSEGFLTKLGISCDVNDIPTNLVSVGVVREFNSEISQFIHKSFAEYFAALCLFENYSQQAVINDAIIDEKYAKVCFFLDLFLAKGCPPHVQVLYRKCDVLREHKKETFKWKDAGGRTILELASFWKERYPQEPERHDFQEMYQFVQNVCNNPNIVLEPEMLP